MCARKNVSQVSPLRPTYSTSRASEVYNLKLVPQPAPTLAVVISGADLQRHAELLASQLRHDLVVAVEHGTDWYQGQMVAGASYADAAYLRMLTTILCREHRALVTEKADLIGRSPVLDELRRSERLRETTAGVVALGVLLLALLFGWWSNHAANFDVPGTDFANKTRQVQL